MATSGRPTYIPFREQPSLSDLFREALDTTNPATIRSRVEFFEAMDREDPDRAKADTKRLQEITGDC